MQVDKFTIAVTDMEGMVAFYNAVFDAGLTPIPDTPFYAGKLGAMQLLFCPNTITQIEAEKNRIQMRLVVDDIAALIATAAANGGGAYGDPHEDDTQMMHGISDPDGNSFELIRFK